MKQLFTTIVALSVLNLFAGMLQFECSSNKDDSIYKAGDKIVFTVKLLEDGQPAADKFILYQLYHDNKLVKSAKGRTPSKTTSSRSGENKSMAARIRANRFIMKSGDPC